MNLLQRVACSQGNPLRAKIAMRLICEQRLHEFGCGSVRAKTQYRFACLDRPEVVANSIELRRHMLTDSSTTARADNLERKS